MTPIHEVLNALGKLAPLHLAAPWDNVGLLVEGTRDVSRVACAIDCTPAVAAETLAQDVDLLVSYHPPIFGGLKQLTHADPMARSLIGLIRAGVHVYSPHTALDAVAGGVNDWLLEGFGALASSVPLEPCAADPAAGLGRRAELASPLSVEEALSAIRRHLGLPHLWWMEPHSGPDQIKNVAVCPGAGGSLLAELSEIDLVLTGEMRHHDQLALAGRGVWVVTTGHTSTERGYLPRLVDQMRSILPDADIQRSNADRTLLHWG